MKLSKGSRKTQCPEAVQSAIRAIEDGHSSTDTRLGVERIRVHDLRHACATPLLTAGEELAVIGQVLGHANDVTTLKVYAFLEPKRA